MSIITINQAKLSEIKKDECKYEAKQRIASSDWSVLPDMSILNSNDFITYREELRALIKDPIENPVWPIEPQPIWRNA